MTKIDDWWWCTSHAHIDRETTHGQRKYGVSWVHNNVVKTIECCSLAPIHAFLLLFLSQVCFLLELLAKASFISLCWLLLSDWNAIGSTLFEFEELTGTFHIHILQLSSVVSIVWHKRRFWTKSTLNHGKSSIALGGLRSTKRSVQDFCVSCERASNALVCWELNVG